MTASPAAIRAVLLRKVEDLLRAVQDSSGMHARQVMLSHQLPAAYDEKVHTAAMAQAVQSLYTRTESILKDLLRASGEELAQTGAWHSDLLLLAATEQPGLRPAILTQQDFDHLSRLLSFRHAVRNVYASDIRSVEVMSNTDLAFECLPIAAESIAHHIQWLAGPEDPKEQAQFPAPRPS